MNNRTKFIELKRVYEKLHSPQGCMWDREQTHETLIPYLEEEAEEFIQAVKEGDYTNIKDELGDVLLQVMFHAQIAKKAGKFDIEDVIDNLIRKIKRRHPHVFGSIKVKNTRQIKRNWNKIKKLERQRKIKSRKI